MRKLILTFIAMVLILGNYSLIFAKATGPCSDCHTMHNSQGGSAVDSSGPYNSLTKGNCVGCHTGTNNGSNEIPYVLDSSAPTYNFDGSKNTLAGGNFYWVKQGTDADGHNVVGISSADATIGQTPPGFNSTDYTSNGAVGTNWSSNQLTCAGSYGCHGDHSKTDNYAAISGAHHTNDSTIDGSSVGKSFRFLLGIKGTEDSDWEYTATSSAHNGYYASDYQNSGTIDSASINYLCAECHGNFHKHSSVDDSTTGSPWLRHPTDYDMNNVKTKEYGSYPNASLFSSVSSSGDYFSDVPVGTSDGSVKSTVLAASGDAIVLCISCHRAHGSNQADLLRWDYSQCTAGSSNANCGCFACHTNK
jgi:predicted CXXCH cytochrome family protein